MTYQISIDGREVGEQWKGNISDVGRQQGLTQGREIEGQMPC